MGSLYDRQGFETFLSSQGYSEERKAKEREDFENRRRRLLISDAASEETAAQASGPLRRAAGMGVAGLMNFANTASLGYLPKIAGAVAGPESRERMDVGLEASRMVNPGASMAGSLGAFFTPGSMARTATRAGASALTKATGIGILAEKTVESTLKTRAATQITKNLVGAAGGLGALRLLESREDDAGLSGRLSDAASDFTSPETLGLSVAFGGASARLTGPRANPQLQRLFDQYRKVTGKEVPPDVATNNRELQGFMDTAARTPGLKSSVDRVRSEFVKGMREILSDIGKRAGGTKQPRPTLAAGGISSLKGAGREVGAVTAARRGPQQAAMALEGGEKLPLYFTQQLRQGVRLILEGRPGGDPGPSGEMRTFMRDFYRQVKSTMKSKSPTGISLQDLEAFRKRIGKMAYGWGTGPLDPKVSDPDRIAASKMYTLFDEMIERTGPGFSRALHAGERLRRMEDSLKSVKVSDLDDVVIRSFWAGKGNVLKRWEALQEFGSPEDIAALKGSYFWGLIRAGSMKDGTLNPRQLEKLFNGPGMFNKQVVDRVMPGVRSQILDHAQLADVARKGILAPEGSQTAGRAAMLGLAGGATVAVPTAIAAVFANPLATVATLLGTGSTAWVIRRAARSMIEGMAGQKVSSLAQGIPPTGLRSLPAAIQSQGGAPGIGAGLIGLGKESTQLLGGIPQEIVRRRGNEQ